MSSDNQVEDEDSKNKSKLRAERNVEKTIKHIGSLIYVVVALCATYMGPCTNGSWFYNSTGPQWPTFVGLLLVLMFGSAMLEVIAFRLLRDSPGVQSWANWWCDNTPKQRQIKRLEAKLERKIKQCQIERIKSAEEFASNCAFRERIAEIQGALKKLNESGDPDLDAFTECLGTEMSARDISTPELDKRLGAILEANGSSLELLDSEEEQTG